MKFPTLTLAASTALALAPFTHAEVTVKEVGDRVRVAIDGRLFTELRHADAPHVYYYPLIGPGGLSVTRSWPMDDPPDEEHDHPHHRSLWFSHGLVNGIDFWSEPASHGDRTPAHPVGKIVHDKVLETKSGEEGVVRSSQKWVAPDGTVPVTSVQTLRVYQRPANERLFDFEITLTAGDKDVVFGDTKEGTFAIRIAESMRLKGPKNTPGKGHIVNDSGLRDGKVWGQKAKWVDMFGPVEGKTLGIAIFDHPTNHNHPTRWHARDYGLFAANPFCGHEMDKTLAKGAADMPLAAGKSVTLRYRVLIHEGEPDKAKLDAAFAEFSKAAR